MTCEGRKITEKSENILAVWGPQRKYKNTMVAELLSVEVKVMRVLNAGYRFFNCVVLHKV